MAEDPAPPSESAAVSAAVEAPAVHPPPVATPPIESPPSAATAVATDAPPAAQEMSAETLADVDADLASAQASIDELLKQANLEDPSAIPKTDAAIQGNGFDLPDFQQVMQDAQVSSIDLLRDVELNVKIELGRSRMLVEDVLKLAEGSVVELDKLAGDPVDVFVNDRLVARGEVLVLNDNFCVRVNEIVASVKDEGL
jgi:flagellar motor switch protein FliN/FliY